MTNRQITVSSVFGIIVVSLALLVVFVMLKPPKPQPKQQKITKYVKAEEVTYKEIRSPVSATGRLSSREYVDVISEVSGQILQGSLPLKKGQSFKKGQILLKIFSDEAELALKARKSRFLNSIANLLPDFKIDFPDSYKTWTDFFNEIDLEKDLSDLPKIRSPKEKIYLASRNILSDFYNIKSDEIRLKKHSITAPFDGAYTEVYLEVGSVANPGSRIAKIISTERLELEVPVEISNAKWIKTGDAVFVSTKDRSGTWKGHVVRKSEFVADRTQSISIFVGITPNIGDQLFKGQYLLAEFPGREIGNVMEIPRNAVFNFNEVFIVNDGRLKKKTIDIVKTDENTLLFNGLDEGSMVVTEPLINVVENSKVKILH